MCFSALEEPSQNASISLLCEAWELPLSCSVLVSKAFNFEITIEASIFQEFITAENSGRLEKGFVNTGALLGCHSWDVIGP